MSHNTFGHLFRVTTWGESHGPALGATVDGCPPGVTIDADALQHWLETNARGVFSRPIAEYVVVHEMAHLREPHHTPEFWRRVERMTRRTWRSGGSARPLPDHVSGVTVVDDEVEISTDAGPLRARHVVDTRPPPASQRDGATLFQCFAGRELLLDAPGVDERRVELMTDMRADALGFVFSYVLPLTPTRVLVEATRFATRPLGADVLAADLDALVAARGWARATVLRTERAVLPMGLPRAPADAAPRGVVLAGTAGGALRAVEIKHSAAPKVGKGFNEALDALELDRGFVIAQVDAPYRMYEHPQSEFISRFVGKTNLLPGRVTRCGTQAEVETGALRVLVDGAGLRHGDSVQLSLRPEKLVPVPAGQGKLSCVVSTRYFLGSQWMYGLDSPVGALTVLTPNDGRRPHDDGEQIGLDWAEGVLRVLPVAAVAEEA